MSRLSELKAQETPVEKTLKTAPEAPFVGHIALDELEARIEELAAALPAGWVEDKDNVAKSYNPNTGTFQRYLMLRNDEKGSNVTVYCTGSVSIVRPTIFEAEFGKPEAFGIMAGKAVAVKWAEAA